MSIEILHNLQFRETHKICSFRFETKKCRKQKYSNRMSGKHFSCKKCDQRFHSKVKMEYHMKNADSLTKCEHCDYKSCNLLGVTHHMNKIHAVDENLRLKCPKCDQKFETGYWNVI